MQIILKENEEGKLCLFDTRSGKFFQGGCVKNAELGKGLLDTANALVKKPTKILLEIVQSRLYGDAGYMEWMLAERYLSMNQDLAIQVTEKLKAPKKDKKTSLGTGKRGRPRKKV